MFYGDITIPSDIPAWVAYPESGSPVNIGFDKTQGTLTSVKNKFKQSAEYNRAWGIIDCKDSNGFTGNQGFGAPYDEATINLSKPSDDDYQIELNTSKNSSLVMNKDKVTITMGNSKIEMKSSKVTINGHLEVTT